LFEEAKNETFDSSHLGACCVWRHCFQRFKHVAAKPSVQKLVPPTVNTANAFSRLAWDDSDPAAPAPAEEQQAVPRTPSPKTYVCPTSVMAALQRFTLLAN
jgi:hypothetical protein